MLHIKRILPDDNAALRRDIYDGALYIVPATAETTALVEDLRAQMRSVFNVDDLTRLHAQFDADEIAQGMGRVRDTVKSAEYAIPAIGRLLDAFGFDTQQTVFDVLRLRCVPHEGFTNPKAAHSYTAHRDTWYANPACQINWWIPLFDVSEQQTFRFYPRYFAQEIANSSGGFDYRTWADSVGFQAKQVHSLALYPTVQEPIEDAQAQAFACKAGDVVLFSAAHLHQTCNNDSGLTRFNVDFRTVHKGDMAAGAGAPDPDNRSAGNATEDYFSVHSPAMNPV